MVSLYGNRIRQVGFGGNLLPLMAAMLLAVLSSSSSSSSSSVAAFTNHHNGPARAYLERSISQMQEQELQLQLQRRTHQKSSRLHMAPTGSSLLKPAAGPLMDSGKALARSGELLIDFTKALDLYGGALSNAGAQIRNAGDALAQAGASCRFKTGLELVIDELREAAACLSEATDKLDMAVREAEADKDVVLLERTEALVGPARLCAAKLEQAGAGILMRQTLKEVGASMEDASVGMGSLAAGIGSLAEDKAQNADGILSSQRMTFASERLRQAGIELKGEAKTKKPEGRAFLKGGGFS